MENNIDLKKKFFGLYYGQEVQRVKTNDKLWKIDYDSMIHLDHSDYLELTPLSQITDEVAIAVDFMSATHFINVMKSYGADFNGLLLKHEHIDILRYNGYAVDWMGLSVEELVAFGWVKLKQI